MEQHLIFVKNIVIGTVFFILILLSKHWRRELSKRVLALIQISLLIAFLAYFDMGSSLLELKQITSIAVIIPFILGPLFFYYIQIIYEKNFLFSQSDFSSFLPFLMSILFFSIPYSIVIETHNETLLSYIVIIPVLGIIYFIYYMYRSFLLLKKFRMLLIYNYASVVEKDLNWILVWGKGLLLFLVLDFSSALFIVYGIDPKIPMFFTAMYFAWLIFYLGYHGIYQSEVPLEVFNNPDTENENTVYTLKDEKEVSALTNQLEELFEKKKIFKENTISLKQVADKLGTTDKKLSELINSRLNSNFYEFVNNYRIQEFTDRVKNGDTERFTLLSVAFESGFNSKASFNRIFKKRMGTTPSQYMKRNQLKKNH